VRRLEERLLAKGIALRLDEGAIDFLADRGFDPAFGARPVKRAIQRELESSLAKVSIWGKELRKSPANRGFQPGIWRTEAPTPLFVPTPPPPPPPPARRRRGVQCGLESSLATVKVSALNQLEIISKTRSSPCHLDLASGALPYSAPCSARSSPRCKRGVNYAAWSRSLF